MISLSEFEPIELGLPAKFSSFRPSQIEALEWAANVDKRVIAASLPTGFGKSLWAMALSKVLGLRTMVLTSTLGLMDQYLRDFESCGLVDIRGKANYRCADKQNLSCRFGPHEGCRLAGCGCTYESRRDRARAADLVVTNYAYWIRGIEAMRRNLFAQVSNALELPDNPVGMLVLDEGHRASEELSKALRVELRETWLHTAKLKYHKSAEDMSYWSRWAADEKWGVEEQLKQASKALKQKPSSTNRDRVYQLEELLEAMNRVSGMSADSWVCELHPGTQYGRRWDFDCIWPGAWAERNLFVGIPKVVIMSATLRPIALQLLGLKQEQYEFREWGRVFPAQNTPVYHIPTVRMNHRTTEQDMDLWVRRIDEIIESRLDRKGIVHTVSYSRQKYLLDRSRFAKYMLANTNDPESAKAAEVVERFRGNSSPSILVSPSFATGWDFPGLECEWQIVCKLPFPDMRSKVMEARRLRSERYPSYLCMQELVQACGRGSRAEWDRCEIFIVDSNIEWFLYRNKILAPKWFGVIHVSELPKPGIRVTPPVSDLVEIQQFSC